MVDRAEKSRKYNVEGLILNINKKTVYYEDQKFVPIVIQNNQQEIELFIRPWLLKSNITEGSSVSLDYVSKVIVSIGVGDKL